MKTILTATSMICCVAVLAIGAEEKAKEAPAPKCPVSGKPCKNLENYVTHNGGKVYLCCANCPKAFKANPDKFSAKANQQLVATGQAKEVKCPFTGGKLNPETVIKVGDAKVCFCCNNCKGKATKATGDDQVALIFNDKAFKKGFKVTSK